MTADMFEITVNHSQRTVIGNVIINFFTFYDFIAFVGAFQWVVVAHRPVVSDDIFIVRFIIFTIFTNE